MPNSDGTGPQGEGPRTGRKGNSGIPPADRAGERKPGSGRGEGGRGGRGKGDGRGKGGGQGQGRRG